MFTKAPQWHSVKYPRASSKGPRWREDRVDVLRDGKCILGAHVGLGLL